jgi:hypothetical protein
VILYWFGRPKSKILHPVLQFVLFRSQVGLHGRGVDGGGLQVFPRRTPLPRSVDGSPGPLQQGNLSLVSYNMESISELP